MLQGIEHMLKLLGVQYLVVPSVPSVAQQVWLPRFGFTHLTHEEASALEDRILLPDPASTELLKKQICRCGIACQLSCCVMTAAWQSRQ